jgi:hypothetical protein
MMGLSVWTLQCPPTYHLPTRLNHSRPCILSTQCIFTFHRILRISCNYFPKQHYIVCLYNRDVISVRKEVDFYIQVLFA